MKAQKNTRKFISGVCCSLNVKRPVQCKDLISMSIVTLLASMVQTYAIFYAGESLMLEGGTEEIQNKDEVEIAKLQHNRMHQIESLTIAPVIFMTILVGFFYEIYSRRSVLFFGFLILPVSMLFFWSTSFAMTAIAKTVLAIGCQTIL